MEFWGNGAAVRRFLPISLRICLWPWQTAAITMCCAGAWRNFSNAFSRIPSGLRTSWPSCRRWESFRFVTRGLTLVSVWTVPELPERAGRGQFAVHYAFYDERVKEQIYRDKRIEAEMKGGAGEWGVSGLLPAPV